MTQFGPRSTFLPMRISVERAVTEVPLSSAPSPTRMTAPGPKTRRRTGACRVQAVARRHEDIMLTSSPISIVPPGQRMRPTGPCARTPRPTVTPRRRALARSRKTPQKAPQRRIVSRQSQLRTLPGVSPLSRAFFTMFMKGNLAPIAFLGNLARTEPPGGAAAGYRRLVLWTGSFNGRIEQGDGPSFSHPEERA